MNKIIPVLIAAIYISGFQMKADAGTGAKVAGAILGTVLCTGIIAGAILDCDHHDSHYRHNRGHYYSGRDRDYRHNRGHYSGRHSGHRHNRCD